jgi:hypothetical protein
VIEGGTNQKLKPAWGADVLRLWVSTVDYSGDVPVGDNILKQVCVLLFLTATVVTVCTVRSSATAITTAIMIVISSASTIASERCQW